MSRKLTRREFVQTSTAAGVALGASPVFGQAPAVHTAAVKPVVVASDNGNVYKNGGAEVGVQKAFNLMTKGADVLDALIAGVNNCELDPLDTQRRLRRPAERRRRRPARFVLHARTDAGAPAASPASKACARRRSSPRPCSSIPITTCSSARARRISRATWASRSKTTSTPRTSRGAVARVEAPHRSRALSRSEEAR